MQSFIIAVVSRRRQLSALKPEMHRETTSVEFFPF